MHITDVQGGSEPNPNPDRGHNDIAALLVIDAHAGDEVKASLDGGVTLKKLLGIRKVINENENLGCVGSEIEADGGTLPIDLPSVTCLSVHHPVPVTYANHDRSAHLLADDVCVRPALLGENLFDGLGQSLRGFTEEGGGFLKDEVLVVGIIFLRPRGRSAACDDHQGKEGSVKEAI